MQQFKRNVNTMQRYITMYIIVLGFGIWSTCCTCTVVYANQSSQQPTKQYVSSSVVAGFSVSEKIPVAISQPSVKSAEKLTAPNLESVDSSADNLMQLKRKLEIERTQMELKRLHSEGGGSGRVDVNLQENIQTIVTGVAINEAGIKIAWLQFADGGSLAVNIGSKIGKYIVTEITLDGVQLSYIKSEMRATKHHQSVVQPHRVQSIYLKRVYAVAEKSKNRSSVSNNSLFTPSPIITGANAANITGNSAEMVPPIRPLR